jgi:hypothetical protein
MKISEAFSGNYLKAADLPQPRVLVVQSITLETIGEDRTTKPVLRFIGEQRGLVLNKSNGMAIGEWYGDDTQGWIGQPVEVFSTTTFFSGRQVPCIRVRRPAVQYQPQPVQQAPQLLVQPVHQQSVQQQPQQLQQPVAIPPVPFDA